MASLAGQVALITGASSGIGAALARELVRRGVDVALAARRVERLEALASELRARGRRALVLSCDVTRDGDCEAAVARAVAELGHLDIAVANAGFGVRGAVERLALDDYRRQLETNVFGVLRTARAALPELRRTRGRLAVMGSVSGWIASPGASPYAMSKHAVRALAYALGHELAGSGVSVTHLSPGFVESEIHQVDNHGVLHPEVRHPTAWLRMPADRAARQIASAIAARRRERVITGHGRAAVFLERHVPWLMAAALRRGGTRARPEPRSR